MPKPNYPPFEIIYKPEEKRCIVDHQWCKSGFVEICSFETPDIDFKEDVESSRRLPNTNYLDDENDILYLTESNWTRFASRFESGTEQDQEKVIISTLKSNQMGTWVDTILNHKR